MSTSWATDSLNQSELLYLLMTLIHNVVLKALSLCTATNAGHSEMTGAMTEYLTGKLNCHKGGIKEMYDA
jgi:hypothetical protein